MNTMPKGVAEFIGATENEAVARFYDKVGLGSPYRRADNIQAIRHVIKMFLERGYEIVRIPIEAKSKTEARYQMSLLYHGLEIASQDISIQANIEAIVVYDASEVLKE